MKIVAALLLLSLALQVYTQANDGIFAFTWTAGFCLYQAQNKRESCSSTQVNLWDSQSFTTHGLWPNIVSSSSFGAFNLNLFQKQLKLIDDMHNYWPPKIKASTTASFLWQHEWETHGKDYAAIIFRLKPQSFPGTVQQRNNALQLAFFQDAINFYKKINIKKLNAGNYTLASFASHIGLAQNEFILQCSSGNILRQLQICYQITKTSLNPKACVKSSGSCANGGQSFVLPDWKVKGWSRVTNYPASLTAEQ